jgi:hypothetical protein
MIFRPLKSTVSEAKPGPGAVEESGHRCRAVYCLVSPRKATPSGVATKFPYPTANKIVRSWSLFLHPDLAVFPLAGERLYLVEMAEE